MNTLDKNYRYEIKYIMSKSTAIILKKKLSLIMKLDPHYNDYYNIRSLYFDDINNTAYHEKMDGVIDRIKYRVRIYNLDDSYISVEVKGKNNDVTFKNIDNITKEEYDYLINKKYDKINVNNRIILQELINKMKYNNLMPKVIVDYNRLAYVYDFQDTRITFDENIKSGMFNYNLFEKDMFLYNVLEDDEVLLEVKYNQSLPSIFRELFKNTNMTRISASKYVLCMEKKGIDL